MQTSNRKAIIMVILFSRDYAGPAVLTAIFLTTLGFIFRYVVSGDNISEPLQTVLISLTTTLYAYIVGVLIKQIRNTVKYSKYAGQYEGYAYKNEQDVRSSDFYRIQDDPQSVASLTYLGGKEFQIKIDVKDHPTENSLSWSGDFVMESENMAKIAWWYTNKELKYSVGYKRAVVKDDVIILFSDDGSIHRREVFIKSKS